MFTSLKKRFGIAEPMRDERIQAQMGRIYRVGFFILAGIILFDLYLQFVATQFSTSSEGFEIQAGFRPFEVLALLAASITTGIMQYRAGIFDENPKYNECESFPVGYAATISGIFAAVVGVATAGGRFYMEVIHKGVENATWAGDIAMGMVFAIEVFGLSMLAIYLQYRSVKKRQHDLMEKLESEDE